MNHFHTELLYMEGCFHFKLKNNNDFPKILHGKLVTQQSDSVAASCTSL